MDNKNKLRDYLKGLDKEDLINIILNDNVKVIKCGECKRFFRVFKEDENGFCMYLDKWRNVDGYCENGERKEG